jgi:hypothetical protein
MRRVFVAGLLLSLVGCDPTAGLSDSANAALPETKRYFDGRGTQVAEGPWNRVVVDLDADTLYHVGARRLDDDPPTFHLFGKDARDGCEVTPNAGTWLMGKPDAAPFRVLPFLESIDERGRGRLRFTDLDCQVQPLEIEDAGRPYGQLYDNGYLVPTKRGFTFADPWRGESRELATDLKDILLWQDAVLVWTDGELRSFSEQFEPGATWGNELVAAIGLTAQDFLVEDADGLHHVTLDHQTLEISATPVLEGACRLQQSPLLVNDDEGRWLVAEQPCGNPRPTLLHVDADTFETLDTFELPFEADARYARPLIAGFSDDDLKPVGALYLTDVEDGYGTLWVWRADLEAPFRLGERASLDSVVLDSNLATRDGIANVNYRRIGAYEAYDLAYFRWDGDVQIVAERVVRNTSSGELLVDFDGVAGDIAAFTDDGYRVYLSDVPPSSGESISYTGDLHFARVDEFDGAAGRLLLGSAVRTWAPLAEEVPPESVRFAWFMPALLFIEDWNAERNTGSLVAYNYELDARTTIAEGVSSYDLTGYPWDGVVYAVPSGKQRGVWFSKAK